MFLCKTISANNKNFYFSYSVWQNCLSQSEVFNLIRISNDHLGGTYTNSITQDSFGFMWFGTKNGLLRFDGRNVKLYNSVADDSTSLASDQIQTLYTDSKGNLWIACRGAASLQY